MRLDHYQMIVYPLKGEKAPSGTQSVQHDYILKARRKTLKVLILTCGSFFLLWTPYVVNRLFLMSLSDRSEFRDYVPSWLDKVCELMAVSNVVISPLVYGNFLLKIWRLKNVKEWIKC